MLGAVAGIAVALLPWPASGMARVLVGWVTACAVYLVLAWWLAHRFDAAQTQARARALDPPDLLLLTSVLAVVGASVVAIVMLQQQVKTLSGWPRGLHVALSLMALTGSWLVMHTLYAFHYAHRYYQDERQQREGVGGLDFPGTEPPAYVDFMYYAFVVGMTSQVSDVAATSAQMRRITLVHSMLSFGFNMLVLALSINVVAGLMQ